MPVSSKYVLHQTPVIASIGRVALKALLQKKGVPSASVHMPGPELKREVPPRSPELVRAYIRAVGGDPSAYKKELPPHLFPQWSFPVVSETLFGIPYPLLRVMNGGCRLEWRGPAVTRGSGSSARPG